MSRSPRPYRAAVAAAAAVVLLTACGGDGGDGADASATTAAESASGSAAESASGSASGSGSEDFCTQAAGLDDRVDAALSGLGDDDPSVPDAFREIAEELRAIEAPEPIAADWDTLSGGLDRLADSLADLDLTDPGSLTALEDAGGELATASDHVDAYLRDECGT